MFPDAKFLVTCTKNVLFHIQEKTAGGSRGPECSGQNTGIFVIKPVLGGQIFKWRLSKSFHQKRLKK